MEDILESTVNRSDINITTSIIPQGNDIIPNALQSVGGSDSNYSNDNIIVTIDENILQRAQ